MLNHKFPSYIIKIVKGEQPGEQQHEKRLALTKVKKIKKAQRGKPDRRLQISSKASHTRLVISLVVLEDVAHSIQTELWTGH